MSLVDPGTYRYVFSVDGLRVADPTNTAISESNTQVWSVVHVPGSDFMDTTNVPRTTPMAKAPPRTLTRYSAPAIRASRRGDVSELESMAVPLTACC